MDAVYNTIPTLKTILTIIKMSMVSIRSPCAIGIDEMFGYINSGSRQMVFTRHLAGY